MKRVAAYCRVSTDNDDQVNSLESQKKYFREYIERNPMWELSEVYVDEGLSGTSTKKRHSFNKMIEDAGRHQFDLILTKEISRFARNTLDSIYFTRKLKDYKVGVIFMNDNINTLDPDAELRLTIMSSIAQEESRKTSDRVKWGQKRRMEQGVVFGRDLLGYDVRNGQLFINEDGAETVKLIFHKFTNEGKGTHVIARELREANIKTATYMKTWSNTAILRILRNEKYCGDLIQKKTLTPNYLNHEKIYNCGEEDFVIIRDHHTPIISSELFDKTQRELERRSPSDEVKEKHSNRYCFSGKIKCGICGASFVSRTKKRKDESIYKAWKCYESANHGSKHVDKAGNEVGCNNHSIGNADLEPLLKQVIKNLLIDRNDIIFGLCNTIKTVLNMEEKQNKPSMLKNKVEQLNEKKQSLLELYLNKDISKVDYRQMAEKIDADTLRTNNELKEFKEQTSLRESQEQILKDIIDTVNGLATGDIWDDTFYRGILDKIVMHPNNVVDIYLKLVPEKWSYFFCDKNFLNRHFDTSVGTEELAHFEMIGAIVHQLTRNLTIDEVKKQGFSEYFVDHTLGIYPIAASGAPFTASYIASKGDAITDITEDMAAEQKARTTYDNILRLADDPDVRDPIKFLRAREIVHFQRFGEALRIVTDKLDSKNFYAINPEFDGRKR